MGKIIERKILLWNDGSWSEDLYALVGKQPQPKILIDDIEGYVYKGMCYMQSGLKLYYREEI
jgi:hypothetical protein